MALNTCKVQRIIICFLISILLLFYPIYLSYIKDSGGIFLALVIIVFTLINLVATSLIMYINRLKKTNINIVTFFCVLSFCIILCLAWNFTKEMNWLYYISVLINIACFIFLIPVIRKIDKHKIH